MIKAVLVDDEPLARSMVAEYLEGYSQVDIVAECNDGFEGAKAIMQHQPDIVFLDIQMPKINGFEMLEIIDKPPAVIFTTAFDEYAIRAFEQHAVDYLLKPITKARFDQAMAKFLDTRQMETGKENTRKLLDNAAHTPGKLERLVIKTGAKIKIVPVTSVLYLEADDDYVRIHTDDGTFLKNKTMAAFEAQLDPLQFVRVHRSFIVKIDHIIRLEPHEKDGHIAILTNGKNVSVSKAGYARLKQLLGM
ncbi:LytTR family transcriptional regulator DNA-binding domain-containing protein [Parapedobacter sp. ISTM3]|uniref:Two component transcriptional regulator, LytTR family n=1 Tax=Parapedobacter luteus TaxID=623280 RepID=A0A1T5AK42_9SPHI|nr:MULTISPECIES: LytTR family transcriptional regulator DNA-binding domain-containing protein [Parapedobacter]MBK1441726.1 LytTR family transcriptional regulator DNA-binding domain-containing protein [Parapedobacter sp. ISTM3]SKB35381.1 two component transcriptional regulator, LytTR family [Parapedobacter luteus]